MSRAFLLACAAATACAPQLEDVRDDRSAVSMALPFDATANESNRWQVLAGPGHLYALQTSAASAGGLWFSFAPEFGSTIRSVSARLSAGAPFTTRFQHAALPEVMPTVTLYVMHDGEAIEVASAMDTSASVAEYDAFHDVTARADHFAIPGLSYAVRVSGEAGENAAASVLSLVEVRVSVSTEVVR